MSWGRAGMRDHPRTRNTQAEFEAVVFFLFGGAVAVIGLGFEAAVATAAGIATHGQRQGVNNLHRIRGLPADFGQVALDRGFHLPQVGGLPDK